jgi:hypothetical protein
MSVTDRSISDLLYHAYSSIANLVFFVTLVVQFLFRVIVYGSEA